MANGSRTDGPRVPLALEALDAEGDGPTSEVRPLDASGRQRKLCIATRLRGPDAESALVTVTDDTGTVRYEGALRSDGTVTIVLDGSLGRVRVLVETARWHRQADVIVDAETTEHAFA
jgi:hypothetical protein